METQTSHPTQIIEINMDVSPSTSVQGGNKICGGAVCDFSDFKRSSNDAKERSASMKKLLTAVVLCVIFMTVEVAGGIKANSLAILTDAAHLMSDVAAFAISLFSLWASGWEATPRQSYGFFRIEILGALVSIQLIWLLAGILVYQAILRIIHDNGEVQGLLMFAVSAFGLVVNIIMAVMLGHDHGHGHGHGHGGHHHGHEHGHVHGKPGHDHSRHHHHDHDHEHTVSVTTSDHHHHPHPEGDKLKPEENAPLLSTSASTESEQKKKPKNINVYSAYLHVIGDCIQSIGVMIGGAIIWYKPEWKIIDIICTLIFSVIVLLTTIRMLRSILEVLMESTPREISMRPGSRRGCARLRVWWPFMSCTFGPSLSAKFCWLAM